MLHKQRTFITFKLGQVDFYRAASL